MMCTEDEKDLRGRLGEAARQFRRIGLDLDRDPEVIHKHLDLEGVRWLSQMSIPAELGAPLFRGKSGREYDFTSTRERVVSLECLSYGDIGVLLASPGPSLSGQVVGDLGTPEQKARYFSRLLTRPTWTFFALTEPDRGSDAAALTTRLVNDERGFRLHGEKRFIGNGSRAQIGVVFARRNPGPLGIEAVLFDTEIDGFAARALPTMGLRGAGISQLRFDGCAVAESDIIGGNLNPSRRGLWGAILTFNRMRSGVAAMALGVAQASFDYVRQERRSFASRERSEMESFEYRLHAVRSAIYQAAEVADRDPANGTPAMVAKLQAVELVEAVTESAVRLLGPASLIEHPYLNKWYRDARGFEYMEGTSIIQKLQLFQGYRKAKLAYV
jgi:alkylation response protein AidB-like acyl-CoA dehydrogenase